LGGYRIIRGEKQTHVRKQGEKMNNTITRENSKGLMRRKLRGGEGASQDQTKEKGTKKRLTKKRRKGGKCVKGDH